MLGLVSRIDVGLPACAVRPQMPCQRCH